MNKRAFTLIETIIYTAVVAFLLVALTSSLWNVLQGQTKIENASELVFNAQFVTQYVTKKIQEGNDIVFENSILETHPGKLVLATNEGPLTFDTYQRNVQIGAQTVTLQTLRVQIGLNPPIDLTDTRVDVTNFVVKNRTRINGKETIKLLITLATPNPSQNQNFSKTFSFEAAAALRK